MRMRTVNFLMAAVLVLVNILALVAVISGQHTQFGTLSVAVSLAVSIGVFFRVLVGTAALAVYDKKEDLVDIAVLQKLDPSVPREFARWVREDDREFYGARITDILRANDENGKVIGYWLLMVGTESTYKEIRKLLEGDNPSATVLDHWPIDKEKWSDEVLKLVTADWEDEMDDDDPIEELKG